MQLANVIHLNGVIMSTFTLSTSSLITQSFYYNLKIFYYSTVMHFVPAAFMYSVAGVHASTQAANIKSIKMFEKYKNYFQQDQGIFQACIPFWFYKNINLKKNLI